LDIKAISQEQLKDYVNARLQAGDTIKDISEEQEVNRNYISRKLKDYVLNKESKQYEPKAVESIEGQITTEELQGNYTTKHLQNDYTTEELHYNYTTKELQLNNSNLNDLMELIKAKEDIKNMIEWYKLNNTVVEAHELKIDSKEFTGDLQPRSYKLYENVREALKDFTEKHKEYKAQDIVNKAIMEFVLKYGK